MFRMAAYAPTSERAAKRAIYLLIARAKIVLFFLYFSRGGALVRRRFSLYCIYLRSEFTIFSTILEC
jgi:hypothetical protein